MTTARQIVYAALRKARVTPPGDEPSAENAGAALDDLNMMIPGWNLRGVEAYSGPLALDDEMLLGPEFDEGTVHLLAARIAADYAFPVTFNPRDFFADIQAATMKIEDSHVGCEWLALPSRYMRRNL